MSFQANEKRLTALGHCIPEEVRKPDAPQRDWSPEYIDESCTVVRINRHRESFVSGSRRSAVRLFAPSITVTFGGPADSSLGASFVRVHAPRSIRPCPRSCACICHAATPFKTARRLRTCSGSCPSPVSVCFGPASTTREDGRACVCRPSGPAQSLPA